MDGRVLHEVFEEGASPRRSGTSYLSANGDMVSEQAYSNSEEAALREKLRALGYIE
jgi:hypothetical protein